MWRRIVNGKGRAFYEIGVADDGSNFGIQKSMLYETLAVLFYNARKLEKEYAKDQAGKKMEIKNVIELVRKGSVERCYSVKLMLEAVFDDAESLISSEHESPKKLQEQSDSEDELLSMRLKFSPKQKAHHNRVFF